MRTTIHKCDRCKAVTDELIEYEFINRNIELKDDSEKDIFNYYSFLEKAKKYPKINGELCKNCIQEISRWLGHSENILKGVKQ